MRKEGIPLDQRRFLPDKAIDLIDKAGSRIRLQYGRKSVPDEARELVQQLKKLDTQKKEASRKKYFEKAYQAYHPVC